MPRQASLKSTWLVWCECVWLEINWSSKGTNEFYLQNNIPLSYLNTILTNNYGKIGRMRDSYPVFDLLLDLPTWPVPEIKSLLRLSPISYAYWLIHNSSPLSKMMKYCQGHNQKNKVLATQETCRQSIDKSGLQRNICTYASFQITQKWSRKRIISNWKNEVYCPKMYTQSWLTLHICLTGNSLQF
jgi:hypothetical protein